MQRLEVSCAVRRIYTSLGAKGLNSIGQKISFPFLKISSIFPTLYLAISLRLPEGRAGYNRGWGGGNFSAATSLFPLL